MTQHIYEEANRKYRGDIEHFSVYELASYNTRLTRELYALTKNYQSCTQARTHEFMQGRRFCRREGKCPRSLVGTVSTLTSSIHPSYTECYIIETYWL